MEHPVQDHVQLYIVMLAQIALDRSALVQQHSFVLLHSQLQHCTQHTAHSRGPLCYTFELGAMCDSCSSLCSSASLCYCKACTLAVESVMQVLVRS